MKDVPVPVEFNTLERSILSDALKHYIKYCEECLETPGNEDQLFFIRKSLEVSKLLLKRIPK